MTATGLTALRAWARGITVACTTRLHSRRAARLTLYRRLPPRLIAVAAGADDAGMSVIYRQFINRDLPRVERGCTSKAVFLSRSEARSSARRNRRNDGSLHPYHCRTCDWWHLGHRR